ncbi:MAG: permease [Bdellovibrionales bacterium]|nr:permease [Bdellovibrionales bacterium]
MSSCCHVEEKPSTPKKIKLPKDFLLKLSAIVIFISFVFHYAGLAFYDPVTKFSEDVVELMNSMWVGLILAAFFVGIVDKVPRDIVIGILGTRRGMTGLLRATAAGLVLDLCNHGILVVGMKLYERGASLGQTIAFLVASPWNSFSMTLILVSLIGLKQTLLFIFLSAVVALTSGYIFELLVQKGVLPDNENAIDLPENAHPWKELAKLVSSSNISIKSISHIFVEGIKGSKSILKWILFGTLMAATLRMFMTTENFQTYLGPSLLGLALTVIGATIIEVCSEGSVPIAADLVNLAKAPGNGFTFLMTGVSTDYTEIMALKETTGSWKIALFLPIITVPQVILLGYLLNQ